MDDFLNGQMFEQIQVRSDSGRAWEAFMETERAPINVLGATVGDLAKVPKQVPIVYRCIDERASLVASAAFTCSKPEMFKKVVRSDTFNFWYEVEAAYLTFGNVYNVRLLNENSEVGALGWLHPTIVTPELDDRGEIKAYKLGRTQQAYYPEEVVHLRAWNSETPALGASPLESALNAINIERFIGTAVSKFWGRGGRPLGLLTTDQQLTEEQIARVSSWWDRLMNRVRSGLRVPIVSGGFKWQNISFAPGELAMTEQRLQNRLDICHALSVSPELVGVREGNYATMRESRMEMLEGVIIPQLTFYEIAYNDSLPGLGLKFDKSPAGLERLLDMQKTQGWRRQ